MSNVSYLFSIEGPSCANQCTNNNVTNECQAQNSCLCNAAHWSTNYACCAKQACNETDFETSIQNWKNICAMEVVPPVTVTFSSCVPTATPSNGPNSASSTPVSAPAGQSTPSLQNSDASTSMPTQEKYEIGIGVGVGVPVLVALVLMAIICARVCRRRRRARSPSVFNLDRVYGTSSENLRENAYLEGAQSVPTTMYANPRSPLDSVPPSNRMPLSPPAMEVPLVLSRGPMRTLEPPSPLRSPPAFEAFHPSKLAKPVVKVPNPGTPISEHSYPSSLQRPESPSSLYSEKGPFEMGP